MNNQSVLAAAPDHIADASKMVAPAGQGEPDVAGLVEALEAALMVMTSKEVRLEKKADAITMARTAIAAHHKGGE